MLKPQEILEKSFEKALIKGYVMDDVDSFIKELAGDYEELYRESIILKSKVRVLVEKIEEYRSVDDQMRKALHAAKKEADSTVEQARAQAQAILSEARRGAGERAAELSDELRVEEARLDAAKRETVRFATQIRALYEEQIKRMSAIPDLPLQESPQSVQAAREIDSMKSIEAAVGAEIAREDQETRRVGASAAVPEGVKVYEFSTDGTVENEASRLFSALEDTLDRAKVTDLDSVDQQFGPNAPIYGG